MFSIQNNGQKMLAVLPKVEEILRRTLDIGPMAETPQGQQEQQMRGVEAFADVFGVSRGEGDPSALTGVSAAEWLDRAGSLEALSAGCLLLADFCAKMGAREAARGKRRGVC